MIGIFEVIHAGIQSKTFEGKTNSTLACLQNADLTHVKIPTDELLRECNQLELYKPIKVELDVTKGQFNGATYVNYKLVRILKVADNKPDNKPDNKR